MLDADVKVMLLLILLPVKDFGLGHNRLDSDLICAAFASKLCRLIIGKYLHTYIFIYYNRLPKGQGIPGKHSYS